MKTLIFLFISLCSLASYAAGNVVGREAPAFSLPARDGKTLNLADYKGKVVYLDFWASWCGPCRKSFAWMNEAQAKYGAQGLQIVGVNLDEKSEDAQKFLKETPAQFAIAFDQSGKVPGSYGLKGMPTSYLIGRDGKVIAEHVGFKDADRAVLEGKIQAALEGK
jgi:peroxiredoxin